MNEKNPEIPLGLHAIIDELGLQVSRPVVRSALSGSTRKTKITDSEILELYPSVYRPEKGIIGQLHFALKYEPIHLGVYKAAFPRLKKGTLEHWIQSEPNGIFSRRAWYLYELLTEKTLDAPEPKSGPYIDLLDPELHIPGPIIRVKRQRVFDNLLGNKDYCPFIRRTEALDQAFQKNLDERAKKLVSSIDTAILRRAVHYLFTKETKSSFAIEGEAPSKDRAERFVVALMRAAKFDPTTKPPFIELQNAIVDPRYAEKDWRDIQVYVGETLPDYSQRVHFVCPQPQNVPSLMDGWMKMTSRLLDPDHKTHPVCAAAATAFGFVFIHPFVDGNGRIHRFLVHNVLSKMNFTPQGVLFPISAAMLRDMASYDRVLERFSTSIDPFIHCEMDAEQKLTVSNDTADLYRYFDVTAQAEYLFASIEDTIVRDLKDELAFLKFFDAAVRSLLSIVDMPNQRASLLVRLIHQNKGKLSKNKRQSFAELTDEEIHRIETVVIKASNRLEKAADG